MAREFWLLFAGQITSFLGLLVNPFYLTSVCRQLLGQLAASLRAISDRHGVSLEWSRLQIPFQGRWKVMRGGVTRTTSHSWALLSQRYAYDFLVVDEKGQSSRGRANTVSDYFSWGRSIHSPTTGVMVRVEDRWGDNPAGARFRLPLTCRTLLGNHVVIQQESRSVFVLIAHLQSGSCVHRVGDRVNVGDYIGRCGNSGISTEPHVHLQVQDRPDFFSARGLPVAFERVTVLSPVGTRRAQVGVVRGGDLVETAHIGLEAEATADVLPRIVEHRAAITFLFTLVGLVALVAGVAASYYQLFRLVALELAPNLR